MIKKILKKTFSDGGKAMKKVLPKKNHCKKGTVYGVHKIIDVIKNNNGEKVAIECHCCARKTYHPVMDGKPQYSKVAIIVNLK